MNKWILLTEKTPARFKQVWIIVVDSDSLPNVRLAWYNGYDFVGDIYSAEIGTSQTFTYPMPKYWMPAEIPQAIF
jgi:hypothetical protein